MRRPAIIAVRAAAAILALAAAACAPAGPPPGGQGRAPEPAEAAPSLRPFPVRVTGRDYRWHILYPGPDGRLGTPDDRQGTRDLHLPRGAEVEVDLRSEDFAYGFYLPQFEVLEVAMPGSPFLVRLTTLEEGTFELLGNQMCGYTHPELIGRVVVHPAAEYAAALREQVGS